MSKLYAATTQPYQEPSPHSPDTAAFLMQEVNQSTTSHERLVPETIYQYGWDIPLQPALILTKGDFLFGGLAGAVDRQAQRSAVNAATGYTETTTIGNSLYKSSLNKGGDFANNVISNIAQGNYGQVGSIKGPDAEKAFVFYMGMSTESSTPLPSYTNIEIGGGRITGVETTGNSSQEFAIYHAYAAPSQGVYDTVKSVDGSTWYKQYAQDTVSKVPYEVGNGKVAYHESIVQKLPMTLILPTMYST